MTIMTNLLPWPFNRTGWQARMNADADRLIATMGDAASGYAADLAWREDIGLVHAQDAGHWTRVTLEIDRRLAAGEVTVTMPPPSRTVAWWEAPSRAA